MVKRTNKTLLGCVIPALSLLLLCACSSAPTSQRTLDAADTRAVRSRLSRDQANDVTINAVSLVGTPYRHGGNTPETGFDCSGLIGYVYKASVGVSTPRTVASLADWGQAVPAESVKTGDLVVFTQGGVASHAGIYVGDGRFVHAPSTGGEVRLDQLGSKYWSRQQVAFRRP